MKVRAHLRHDPVEGRADCQFLLLVAQAGKLCLQRQKIAIEHERFRAVHFVSDSSTELLTDTLDPELSELNVLQQLRRSQFRDDRTLCDVLPTQIRYPYDLRWARRKQLGNLAGIEYGRDLHP